MKITALAIVLVFAGVKLSAQFNPSHLELRLGYSIHNTNATHFNYLIGQFNNQRYPHEIYTNLPGIDFLVGFCFGADYKINSQFYLQGLFRNKREYIETRFLYNNWHRGYSFSTNTVQLGVRTQIEEEKWFSHWGGAGINTGVMSVFTSWRPESGNPGTSHMKTVDHTYVLGLYLMYEARFKITRNFGLFIRPNIEYNLPSNVRSLNAWLNPVEIENTIVFQTGSDVKYNKGAMNGIGLDAGLLILLSGRK